MKELGAWVVMMSCAALICGILPSLLKSSGLKSIVKLVCGVFLTVTALTAIASLELPELDFEVFSYLDEGQSIADQGQEQAMNEKTVFIKEGLEAYILDKADALGETINADVILKDGIPESVILQGSISGDSRARLEEVIAKDIGIPKEKQQWTGEN